MTDAAQALREIVDELNDGAHLLHDVIRKHAHLAVEPVPVAVPQCSENCSAYFDEYHNGTSFITCKDCLIKTHPFLTPEASARAFESFLNRTAKPADDSAPRALLVLDRVIIVDSDSFLVDCVSKVPSTVHPYLCGGIWRACSDIRRILPNGDTVAVLPPESA